MHLDNPFYFRLSKGACIFLTQASGFTSVWEQLLSGFLVSRPCYVFVLSLVLNWSYVTFKDKMGISSNKTHSYALTLLHNRVLLL